MSIFTNVAIPSTINDLMEARETALRLIADAHRTIEMAKQELDKHGRYLMPHGASMREDLKRIRSELDSSLWRRAFDLTGFRQLMDAQAVAEFERSLTPVAPEFTEATIRATFIDLRINARAMFNRGVFNVFRRLSDSYRTNAAEPFRIGRKVIMSCMVGSWVRSGLNIQHGYAHGQINDLDRVFQTLAEHTFIAGSLVSAMNGAFEQGAVFEDAFYRAKAFKNGNLHLEFKRLDLLDKVNEHIAEFYANGALPDARAA